MEIGKYKITWSVQLKIHRILNSETTQNGFLIPTACVFKYSLRKQFHVRFPMGSIHLPFQGLYFQRFHNKIPYACFPSEMFLKVFVYILIMHVTCYSTCNTINFTKHCILHLQILRPLQQAKIYIKPHYFDALFYWLS